MAYGGPLNWMTRFKGQPSLPAGVLQRVGGFGVPSREQSRVEVTWSMPLSASLALQPGKRTFSRLFNTHLHKMRPSHGYSPNGVAGTESALMLLR